MGVLDDITGDFGDCRRNDHQLASGKADPLGYLASLQSRRDDVGVGRDGYANLTQGHAGHLVGCPDPAERAPPPGPRPWKYLRVTGLTAPLRARLRAEYRRSRLPPLVIESSGPWSAACE